MNFPLQGGTGLTTVLVVGGAGYIGSHAARLLRKEGFDVVIYDNLSTGYASLVRTVEEVVGKVVPKHVGQRRPGDPPALVADPSYAQKLFQWRATRSLHEIVSTAWNWMRHRETQVSLGPLRKDLRQN